MRRVLQRLSCATVLMSSLTLLGCGGGGSQHETTPVAGKVTLDGQAFGPGLLEFVPNGAVEGGRMATGRVSADGSFVMGSYAETDGVVPGSYTVRLFGDSTDPSMPGALVPVQDQTVTIPSEGSPELVVDLKKGKGPGDLMQPQIDTGASTKL